jgi:hypothetical protein
MSVAVARANTIDNHRRSVKELKRIVAENRKGIVMTARINFRDMI